MDKKLWTIFLIAAICIGYLVGYSIPPMVEAGLIGGEAKTAAVVAGEEADQQTNATADGEVDAATLEYYRSLQKTDSQ